MFYCFEILPVYDIVSVMLLHVVFKVKDIEENPDQNSNVHINLTIS